MKATTTVMLLKGAGLIGGAMCSTLVGSLAQWADNGSPSNIQWAIIIGTTTGAGFASLVAFLSQSYGTWQAEKNGTNGNGTTQKTS